MKFPTRDVYELDCSRTGPKGWDPCGLSTWDTAAGGIDEGCGVVKLPRLEIPLSADYKPIVALQGPPLDRVLLQIMGLVANNANADTPQVDYQFKTGVGGAVLTTLEGNITTKAGGNVEGRLFLLAGLVATRWEFWAKCDPITGATYGVQFVPRFILDRVGNAAVTSDPVGFGSPYVIGSTIGTVSLIA